MVISPKQFVLDEEKVQQDASRDIVEDEKKVARLERCIDPFLEERFMSKGDGHGNKTVVEKVAAFTLEKAANNGNYIMPPRERYCRIADAKINRFDSYILEMVINKYREAGWEVRFESEEEKHAIHFEIVKQ